MNSFASASVRREIDRMLKLSRELEALETPDEIAALAAVREIIAPPLAWPSLEDGACDHHSLRWLEYTGFYHEQTLGDGWMATVVGSSLSEEQHGAIACGQRPGGSRRNCDGACMNLSKG